GYSGSGGSGGNASNPSGMGLESTTQSPYGSGDSNPFATNPYKSSSADPASGSPAATEIESGRPLNDLLRNLLAPQKRRLEGPNVPLDEDTLRHLQIKAVGGKGEVGLRRGAGILDWPAALRDARFAESRKRFADQMADAIEQLKRGHRVKPARIEE